MRKKIFAAFLVLALSASVVGCGKKKDGGEASVGSESATPMDSVLYDAFPAEATDLGSDLLIFVNKNVAGIENKKNDSLRIYNSYFTDKDVDVKEYADRLSKEAIPAMKEYLDELKAIEVKTDEVAALKKRLVSSANNQYKALKNVRDAIKDHNHSLIIKADEYFKKSNKQLDKYNTELSELAASCNIEVLEN